MKVVKKIRQDDERVSEVGRGEMSLGWVIKEGFFEGVMFR